MSRKTAMAELEALLTRAERQGDVSVSVVSGLHVVKLATADVRAILAKARSADRVNESKSNPNRRQ
jgi:enoyl-CoA hydratase/carnithine racemase